MAPACSRARASASAGVGLEPPPTSNTVNTCAPRAITTSSWLPVSRPPGTAAVKGAVNMTAPGLPGTDLEVPDPYPFERSATKACASAVDAKCAAVSITEVTPSGSGPAASARGPRTHWRVATVFARAMFVLSDPPAGATPNGFSVRPLDAIRSPQGGACNAGTGIKSLERRALGDAAHADAMATTA